MAAHWDEGLSINIRAIHGCTWHFPSHDEYSDENLVIAGYEVNVLI